MKPFQLTLALSRVDPAKVSALTAVIAIHALFALALLAGAHPTVQSGREGGSGSLGAMRVNFVPRSETADAPPPPPPPLPQRRIEQVEAVAPAVSTQAVSQISSELTAAVPIDADKAAASEVPDVVRAAPLSSMLPFQTAEPVDVGQEVAVPSLLGPADALPVEFTSNVDNVPMELAQFRKTNSPRYLEAARAIGEQGVVVLRVLVDEAGYPSAIQVAKSTAGESLTMETIRAVSGWRFKPAEREGQPVKGTILVPVYFILDKLPGSFRSWHSAGPAGQQSP
nr:energy transducer TonB [Stenotrophomonas pavanii]